MIKAKMTVVGTKGERWGPTTQITLSDLYENLEIRRGEGDFQRVSYDQVERIELTKTYFTPCPCCKEESVRARLCSCDGGLVKAEAVSSPLGDHAVDATRYMNPYYPPLTVYPGPGPVHYPGTRLPIVMWD